MITTVKLDKDSEIDGLVIEPGKGGGVVLRLGRGWWAKEVKLTPDQAGALIFGIEQAAEASQIARDREAAMAG